MWWPPVTALTTNTSEKLLYSNRRVLLRKCLQMILRLEVRKVDGVSVTHLAGQFQSQQINKHSLL